MSDYGHDEALRPDARGVVHWIVGFGTMYCTGLCANWTQRITGNGLVFGIPCPTKWPTCLFCIVAATR